MHEITHTGIKPFTYKCYIWKIIRQTGKPQKDTHTYVINLSRVTHVEDH